MNIMPDIWGGGAVFGYPESGDLGLHGRLCSDCIGLELDGSDRCTLRVDVGKISDVSPAVVLPEYICLAAEGMMGTCDITMAAVSGEGVYIHCDAYADVTVSFSKEFCTRTCDGGILYSCQDKKYALIKRVYEGGTVFGFACGEECEAQARRVSALSVESVAADLVSPYDKMDIPDSISDTYRPLYLRCRAIVRNGISSRYCFGKRIGAKFTIPVISSSMRAVALKDMYPRYARSTVLKIADHISSDGFLPSDITESCCTSAAPPVICYAFDEVLGNDRDLTEKYYDRLRSCIMYFVEGRDINKDYTYQFASGDRCDPGAESGMPHSPRFDAKVLRSSPDISGYMYLSALAMGNMSRTINRNADIIYWGVLAQRIAKSANTRLFDKNRGLYYDLPIIGSSFAGHSTTAGFMPLYAGFVPEEYIPDMIALTDDPCAFRTGRGIPTVAVGDASYCQDMNRGSMSLFECYKIIKGMVKAGYGNKARGVAGRCLDTVRRAYEEEGILYSHYSSDRAVAHSRQKLFGRSMLPVCGENFEFSADCPETAAFVLAIINMMAQENF